MHRRFWLEILISITLTACGDNHPPKLQPIADQTAAVGVELSIELRATDADGDTLHFDFAAPGLPDIKTRANPAVLSTFADNVAIFRWTPQASDRNTTPYAFDFKVTDGKATTTETVQITVGDSTGSAPVFRQPLGTGTTLDLSTDKCIDVAIVVEDTDSTMVTISEDQPQIEGGMLNVTGPFDATWHWCPTSAEIMAQDRYLLHLLADDGSNQATKSYLIVLRQGTGTNCPGQPPVIMHTPLAPQSTLLDIKIDATVSDDLGIKAAPLVYYSTNQPVGSPNLATMSQVTMTRLSGTTLSGMYEGVIPNPVATSPTGTKKTIYYVIEAKDNDDPTGMCDHVVDAPASGTYAVDVTNPGGGRGTLTQCQPCSSDVQCAAGYDCIDIFSTGKFCARECTGSPPCATGSNCSTTMLTSVDGKVSRFCRPTTMSCTPTMACVDDSYEDNDFINNIPNAMSANFQPGAVPNLVFCPASPTTADEDWYQMTLSTSAIVTAQMKLKEYTVGKGFWDLDLELDDGTGLTVDDSAGITDTEYITACMATGKALVHVLTLDQNNLTPTKYDLTVTRTGPDANEAVGDNGPTTNVWLGKSPGAFNQNICGSEDWFWKVLDVGAHLVVDLYFTAQKPREDLDVRLVQDSTMAQVATGSPIDGGERIDYNAAASDTYYVVVSGHDRDMGANVYQLNVVSSP
jgi:hypothetical protein